VRTALGLAQVNEQDRSHAVAVIVSVAVHVAAGAALLWPQPSAPAAKVVDRVMVVSLMAADAGQAGASIPPAVTAVDKPAHSDPAATLAAAPKMEGGAPQAVLEQTTTSPADSGVTQASASASRRSDEAPAFQEALLSHIEQFRRYPDEARRNQKQGVVRVGFTMDRRGNLIDLWVDQSSGIGAIDEEALATLRRALPLPVIPPSLPDRLNVVLPVSFALR
jgi:protein TonB